MTYHADIENTHKLGSFRRLKDLIELRQYPYDFREAKYVADGKPMEVRCLFGHKLMIKPYELKSAYSLTPMKDKDLPMCWRCMENDIHSRETKHRTHVFYKTNKEILVSGKYIRADMELEYEVLKTGEKFHMKPKDMNLILKHNPRAYVASRGLGFESLIFKVLRRANDGTGDTE